MKVVVFSLWMFSGWVAGTHGYLRQGRNQEEATSAVATRDLAVDDDTCTVYSDNYYATISADTCHSLSNTWWDNRITWIQGSDSTCVTIFERANGKGKTAEHCGADWTNDLGKVSKKASRVCCSISTQKKKVTTTTTPPPPVTTTTTTTTAKKADGGSNTNNNGCQRTNSKTGQLHALTDQYRIRNGRDSVTCHAGLSAVIQTYLETLCAANAGLTHSFRGTTVGGRVADAGLDWRYVSENLARGTHTTEPARVIQMWDGSPGHRENMVSPRPESLGVGYVDCDNGWHYWGQVFADL